MTKIFCISAENIWLTVKCELITLSAVDTLGTHPWQLTIDWRHIFQKEMQGHNSIHFHTILLYISQEFHESEEKTKPSCGERRKPQSSLAARSVSPHYCTHALQSQHWNNIDLIISHNNHTAHTKQFITINIIPACSACWKVTNLEIICFSFTNFPRELLRTKLSCKFELVMKINHKSDKTHLLTWRISHFDLIFSILQNCKIQIFSGQKSLLLQRNGWFVVAS